ncbi:MAG: pyridoxine 5'-phosphate synthase [Myxococcota bacterium]
MPALLSVNINKYALLRNSRGANAPDLLQVVDVVLAAGAHGITVHPRRDQRHVRLDDVPILARHLRDRHPGVELNIECEDHPSLVDLVLKVRPEQCTLVPVTPGELTSDHGWALPESRDRLLRATEQLVPAGIRVSCFADCEPERLAAFVDVGTHRGGAVHGPYAQAWGTVRQQEQVERFHACAEAARAAGLGLNAGHDLDRHNLAGIRDAVGLAEVSIGHAQIVRALEVGTAQSVRELLAALGWPTGAEVSAGSAAPAP